MSNSNELTGALRTERFVGRAKEISAIRAAIQSRDNLRVLYIIGKGGIGKTRLLEEVAKITEEMARNGEPCQYGGLYDFSDPALHSRNGLEIRIQEKLDPEGKYFLGYRFARDEYLDVSKSGAEYWRIEEAKETAERHFIKTFNEFSSKDRVVLMLDTTEVLHYESDLVQQICETEWSSLEVKDWLLARLPSMKNAVIVLAGRDNPQLLRDLELHFAEELQVLRLQSFDEDDTLDYMAAVTEVDPAFEAVALSPDQKRVIHLYTGGLPLHIAFVIELLTRNLQLPEELFDSLEDANARTSGELGKIREHVQECLVAGMLTADRHIDRALPYLALARQGANLDLLGRMTGWSTESCRQVLADLRRFSFVKTRAGSDWVFLHDDMYDLMERYAWNKMETEREAICSVVIQYYSERIDRASDEQEREDLLVERLYYQLLANAKNGYAQYARLADQARFRRDIGFDMRLRNQVLQFCTRYRERAAWYGLTREFIDYDAVVHWVKRYLRIGSYEKAIKVADIAKAKLPSPSSWAIGFQLAGAELDTYHALGLIYTGRTRPGVELLKRVIATLTDERAPAANHAHDGLGEFESWRRQFVLGWAHNNLGYAYWVELGHYYAALEHFRLAFRYFRASDVTEEVANVSDNMGRVYALLGKRTFAEALIERGLELRRKLGSDFRTGLSLNSQAIICLSFGDPYRARLLGEKARAIFERLGDQRSIGATYIVRGRSFRCLGDMWRSESYDPVECDTFLRNAIDDLEHAVEIFSERVVRPVRLIDSLNELGCAHRERADLLRKVNPVSPDVLHAQEAATQYLTECIQRTEGREPVMFVDSSHDLALVFFQAGDWAAAESWLDRAQAAIPNDYRIERFTRFREMPVEERVEEYWRQMGKIEIWKGHLICQRVNGSDGAMIRPALEAALWHYALAVTYLHYFSETPTELQSHSVRIYRNFARCDSRELDHLLNTVLPAFAADYPLRDPALSSFLSDTLGVSVRPID